MDYEKAYKEALNRAKHALDCHKTGIVSTDVSLITSMFPELKVSKDETIRKRLIDFFEDWHENRSHCWGIAVTDILTWLEKQGEQKPTEWSKEDENRFQNIIACIEDCYNEKDAQDLIRWFKSLRHQPKPVWSKADIKMLQLIIDGYQNTEDFSKVDGVFVDWLKSIKDRMVKED